MAGTVTGVNGNQVTVQTGQGTTLTMTVGADAAVRTTVQGSVGDLTTGDRVLVTGGAAGNSGTAGNRQILVLRGAAGGGAAGGTTPPSS